MGSGGLYQQPRQTSERSESSILSTHILKHLINEGIGLRQLCDIAMAFNALHSVTNKNELECICRKWHIHRWNRLLYALLIKYLGVPADFYHSVPVSVRTS